MINITTRKPGAIKPEKFVACVRTLSKLETIIHRCLHTHHKQLLPYPPTYYIGLHALDVEKDTGTIKIILIKSLVHLEEIEVQYRMMNDKISFFTADGSPVTHWDSLIAKLLEKI